ncbi:hypothetical protein GTA08_BOTSDO00527 [Botryosphaeria dothidea]|uniref:Siderophore biosynthesis n=1 Tax=Botryosphaeria dothidea TaxID=55169 RepID=A0A8H4J790_9PEZI|nr:hypothetical protein GTA08_BOTSDO00527 [Botryosphaeria dothidea]
MRTTTSLLATAIMAAGALARTDLSGCTSSVSGNSLIWYVPGTGELCEFLDCGGGRAPPKTTVPGCAAYSGTATYSPNYLPGYGPNATPTAASSSSSTAAAQSPSVTAAPSVSSAAVTSSAAASSSASEGEHSYAHPSSSAAASSSSSSVSLWISISTPVATPVNPLNGASTPSGTPAASNPASFTGAAGRIEAAAGVAVGGVVAALAWL